MKSQGDIRWVILARRITFIVACFVAAPAHAESDKFLCIQGLQGSSTDTQFSGCSDVFGYSQAIETPSGAGGGGGATGRVVGCGQAVVVKQIDAMSPVLFLKALQNARLSSAIVHFRTQGETPLEFLTIKLQDVQINGIANSEFSAGTGQSQLPISMESIKMSAGQVFFTFTPQRADGSPDQPIEAAYDCVRNRPLLMQ